TCNGFHYRSVVEIGTQKSALSTTDKPPCDVSTLTPVDSFESTNTAKALSLEGARLGNGAAAMLSFIDARRNNSTRRMLKSATHKGVQLPHRKTSAFQKAQGKI